MREDRFYVYLHIVDIPFTIGNKDYKQGTVVYVGSGTAARYHDIRGRTDQHILVFDKLKKIIVSENLTFEQKLNVEDEYLDKYFDDGFLFNVKRKSSRNIRLDYQELSEVFYISPNSKSNLKWKIGKYKDKDVGCLCSSTGYWITRFKSKKVQCHRIVYTLYKMQTFDETLIVDHINRDRSNNSPENLRLVNHSGNCRNNSKTKGVYFDKSRVRWISYISINGKQICKTFNVRVNFPNDELESAIDKTKTLAIEWRKHMANLHNVEVKNNE